MINKEALEPYQQRVVEEREALDVKIEALKKFFGTDTFLKITANKQVLFRKQLAAMTEYSMILGARISDF